MFPEKFVEMLFRELFVLALLVQSVSGFLRSSPRPRWALQSTVEVETQSSWQEELDQALSVDTKCDTRREKLLGIVQSADKRSAVVKDIQEALRERDQMTRIDKLSAGETRKALKGLVAFRKQLVRDIIPDLLTKQVPAFLNNAAKGPRLSGDSSGSGGLSAQSLPKLVERVRELSQDPILLQSTTDDVRREIKNIFKSTPEGLDSPSYSVLKDLGGDNGEIRAYKGYSICSTSATSSSTGSESSTSASGEKGFGDALSSGRNFNVLAGYLFGDNASEESMSMTTPVIMDSDNKMSFVLPRGKTASTAPKPKAGAGSSVEVSDVAPGVFAARSFTGIATAAEVTTQRALLEDSLLFEGIAFDNLSLQVLQYNPPYTLPWLRRNEVVLRVTDGRYQIADAESAAAAVVVVAGAGDVQKAAPEEELGDGAEAPGASLV